MEHILNVWLLGTFFILVTAQERHGCVLSELGPNIEATEYRTIFRPGQELALSCKLGYTSILGPRTIVCTDDGEWTETKFKCIAKRCPNPDPLSNGDLYYEDTVYQSTINYTCHEGYTLSGPKNAKCQADGTWSTTVPECKPVSCGLAPIPKFGLISFNKKISGNATYFGTHGTYKCLPPYVLFGNAHAECTASGNWTKTPECRVVTCPPPENIFNGYMSSNDQRRYNFMETVQYGCNGDYMLQGSFQISCQKNGDWSEKPACKAPCRIDIGRGRILYKEKKLWIGDLDPNKVFHNDIVSVYCLDKVRNCGYAVSTQCIDGNLKIPECFKEPSGIEYTFHSGSLPSEIEQC
ncbi:beta-2-glycoprotein 1 [Hippocampus comes]|uniref:Beta-2-glycoprotein 1 n=1 Tax=Hippocampus comes TaxID=109280 RepID=A0A3Q3E9Q5_HIPCM|nr:PREDICTED: beta-2-glycoprotein 1 [Hippocampus comes]XP_019732131.1 PREDICTED: beta-2-glycoprotein 1 [Hippocampus comes]XP_019732132.1 PREDICTED: beta-2-glycoprotein 1 [Hippocampus comes]XP_019732133.1 PREDICTED: beta-2-glycoprotein 1 [Hippocampus comes]XP_019732134.1 PREDICTED: beta-2-glycoprotein 1 [Hippocampus comes]